MHYHLYVISLLLLMLSCSAGTVIEPLEEPVVPLDPAPTGVLALANRDITADGRIYYTANSLLTSPIPGGRGFHIKLNDGYKVYSAHLVDTDGNLVNANYLYPDTWTEATRGSWTSPWRDEYGSDLIPSQYGLRLVIKRADGSAISPDEDVIRSLTYLDDPNLKRLSRDIDGYDNVRKRIDDIAHLAWVPLADVRSPRTSTGTNYQNYYYTEGKTYLSVPYSENDEYSKYVGQHVSLYTFLTAIHNRRSVMYTEDISVSHPHSNYGYTYHGLNDKFCAAFYGTVCSGFTGYIAGFDNVCVSGAYADGNLQKQLGSANYKRVYPDDVQPLDFIWYSGHISIVSDVIADTTGECKYILWAEHTKPGTYITPYTPERFALRIEKTSARMYRWNGWNKATLSSTPWMNFPIDNITYNDDISTMYGDKPAVATSDIFYLNLNRGSGMTLLEVYNEKDNSAPLRTVDVSNRKVYKSDSFGGDWVAFDARTLELPAGKYKARLVGSGSASDWVRWELIDINMNISKSGSNVVVYYDCIGGTPYLARSERTDGIGAGVHSLTAAENAAGQASFSASSQATCVKLFVRGDYGVASRRVFF